MFGQLTVSALACAGLFIGISTDASAKAAWQAHSGGRANDAGRGGMTQTSDDGFITVGESQSFGNGDYDVYVVKTDLCGYVQWSAVYDIGGNDYGRKIKETPDGGFIITGMTENLNNCCANLGVDIRPTHDAFLLKIARDGGVEWTKTYGGRRDDRGTDVELYDGGRSGYLVSGSTASFGAGSTDGWLIATDPAGNVNWSRTYGGAGVDAFNGLVQTASGEIVAAGYTNSYPRFDIDNGTYDIFLVRTDNLGTNIRAYHYGDDRSNEVANSVIEFMSPFSPSRNGDIVVAGYSDLAIGKGSAYLMRVSPDLATLVTDHLYGSGDEKGLDQFRDLVQVPMTDAIFAIGSSFRPKGGFGDYDVLAMHVDDMLNKVYAHVYGGRGNDDGYGIGVDNIQGGFGWNGATTSFTFGGEDQYMGLAFSWLDTYCNESEPKLNEARPSFRPREMKVGTSLAYVECSARVGANYIRGYELLCSTCGLDGNEEGDGSGNELSFRSPLRAPGSATGAVAAAR